MLDLNEGNVCMDQKRTRGYSHAMRRATQGNAVVAKEFTRIMNPRIHYQM